MLDPWGAWRLAGVFAQTSGDGIDLVTLVNYGVLGLIVLLLITNRLALPREVKAADAALAEERKAHDQTRSDLTDERRAHTETRALVFTTLTADVVPALTKSTLALESLARAEGRGGGDAR